MFFWQILDPDQRVPSRGGGEDVQVLRLEDDGDNSTVATTYRRVGNSEVFLNKIVSLLEYRVRK